MARTKTNVVTVKLDNGDSKSQTYNREDLDFTSSGVDGILAMLTDAKFHAVPALDSDDKEIPGKFENVLNEDCKAFTLINDYNFGHDALIRSRIRESLFEQFGPDRLVVKMAKQLIEGAAKFGKIITMEFAMAKAQAQMDEFAAMSAA